MKKDTMVILFLIFIVLACLVALSFGSMFAKEEKGKGTIYRYYGISSWDRNTLYDYCKTIQKPKNDGPIMSVNLNYSFVKENKYSGLIFRLDIKDCEALPNESVCLDQNNCFIKYK